MWRATTSGTLRRMTTLILLSFGLASLQVVPGRPKVALARARERIAKDGGKEERKEERKEGLGYQRDSVFDACVRLRGKPVNGTA